MFKPLRLLSLFGAVMLWAFGIENMVEHPELLNPTLHRFWPAIKESWVAIISITLASALIGSLICQIILDRHYKRKLQTSDRQIDAHDVFQFLTQRSQWGWRLYRKINFKEFVRYHAASEIERAARQEGLRGNGRHPNASGIVYLSRTYWDFAGIDQQSVTEPGKVKTVIVRNSEPSDARPVYSLWFSLDDKERIWPAASFLERRLSKLYVLIKRGKYAISGRMEEFLFRSRQAMERFEQSYVSQEIQPAKKSWPDFSVLDKRDRFMLFEAACYCCDLKDPELPMPPEAQRLYEQWRNEWLSRSENRLAVLMSAHEAVTSAFETVEKRTNTVFNPEMLVTRQSLKKWCDERELRPRFLYKYRRGEP
jgi:hypothetical protein